MTLVEYGMRGGFSWPTIWSSLQKRDLDKTGAFAYRVELSVLQCRGIRLCNSILMITIVSET